MNKVYVFLADGFEEIEALTVVDMLRRVKVETVMVSVSSRKSVTGAHGIAVEADGVFSEYNYEDGTMAVLPGGMPGTNHLMEHEGLKKVLHSYYDAKKYLAAICAAPSVLGMNGLLRGRHATCYPGFEEKLAGAEVMPDAVVIDGTIITSRGMGTAISFGAALVSRLLDEETAEALLDTIQYCSDKKSGSKNA
ncbi:MAG: DJ-1/PfpI family protein [Lachnospiraceae bacterium]|nr:DJ-1/PfpI family protein [Lachnospiraceae bacterium]